MFLPFGGMHEDIDLPSEFSRSAFFSPSIRPHEAHATPIPFVSK
jgi:hypothetical protein